MAAYRFANLVLAILRVVASSGDGIDRTRGLFVLGENTFEIGDGFVGMETWSN